MNRYFTAKITSNLSLNKDYKLLSVSPLSEVIMPAAGQFYMIQVGNTLDPLLKRPFSIFRYKNNSLKFLYRIRGKGTQCLSGFKQGDTIQLVGPLGNGYQLPDGNFIAVAGGIGIASIFSLLERCKKKAYLFYGARNKKELLMLNEAKKLSHKIFISTDDGSEGRKGFLTESLKDFLDMQLCTPSIVSPPSEIKTDFKIYACGPTAMLKEISSIASDRKIKCYVSLEEHMACGIGACLGCVLKGKGPAKPTPLSECVNKEKEQTTQDWVYKRICKEGPVFDAEDIAWG